MATLTTSNKNVLGAFNPTTFTLTASDVLPYTAGQNAELILLNTTGVGVVILIDGASVTTVPVPGAGATTADLSAGLSVTVPANGFSVIRLDTISSYLVGAISMTNGVGVKACILV